MKKALTIAIILIIVSGIFTAFVINPDTSTLVRDQDTLVHTITVANANIYFIQQNGNWLMIDSGIPGDEEKILRKMKDKQIDPAKVKYLILTHGHYDHAGTAQFFQDNYNIKIIGGKDDLPLFESGNNGELCPNGWLAKRLLKRSEASVYPSFKPDILVDKAFDLSELGFNGSIQLKSSHTKGSLVVYIGQFAFVGDLIRGGILSKKKPKTHFFMCDLEHNQQELQDIVGQEEIQYCLPGHFGPLSKASVKKYLESVKN